ncbi:2-phospho-L-lactate guanylyltransferase [Nocardioides maradonensis]
MSFGDGGFVALVPVKPPAIGKSRLDGVADRAALARAIAIDTICAARDASAVARVLVITDDTAFGEEVRALGVELCTDPGGGLNAALRAGSGLARRSWPSLRPVALLADLPALTPALLDAALAAVGRGPAYCSDAEGTGTTLYTAAYDEFDPRFGVGSAAAHRDAGGVPIDGGLAGLRRDVDDAESLAAARVLGLGPVTSALLESVPR